ncbi:MAG TPA: sensor histidine kinase, partial [Chthonomonadaceae bacterium]|nr:sensor histidine kinase [Chthonomonadaceae bacterium]
TAELEAANQALQDEIAERKRAADALQQNQTAIETLNERLRRAMAESHHRIKNNLQGIAAIVEMQRAESGAAVSPAALQRIEQHIVALAIIHDLLTQEAKSDAEFETLSLRAALDKLIPLLQATAGDRKIRCRIADLRLSIRQSASLALLVNELVSNALKHSAGDIHIVVTADAESGRLEVQDEGPGFAPDFDPRQAANTGLELIESVSRWDLQGRVAYENRPEGGGRVVVTFPLVPRAEQMPADR